VRQKTPKRTASEHQGFVPLPEADATEPVTIGGSSLEPGDELLILQEARPPAAVRVVHVGPRRAWVRVAIDLVGGRSPDAEFLLSPGTLVKRRD
jgi:hypothetical protein